MAEASKARGVIKFLVWALIAAALTVYMWVDYYDGTLVSWYYYKAASDGWAVNSDAFKDASKDKPAILEIGSFQKIEGLQAVPVKKGDRLPTHTNGIIDKKTVQEGKRVSLEGNTLKVTVPSQVKESKGFKYRDTFKHKGVETNPWGGVWSVAFILALALALGLMAEGFTDMCGLKLEKIKHYEGVH
ncbi:MAG TPA: hypothetical protein VMC85_03970 [Desulfomonilaceae bacterium]|nr:hypothetical protein [Desulfomonilaceae bacterium]